MAVTLHTIQFHQNACRQALADQSAMLTTRLTRVRESSPVLNDKIKFTFNLTSHQTRTTWKDNKSKKSNCIWYFCLASLTPDMPIDSLNTLNKISCLVRDSIAIEPFNHWVDTHIQLYTHLFTTILLHNYLVKFFCTIYIYTMGKVL